MQSAAWVKMGSLLPLAMPATTLVLPGVVTRKNFAYADVIARSSFSRLGLGLHSTFQPGFRGCASLELHNFSNVPVSMPVGCRIVQARFFKVSNPELYFGVGGQRRKYIGNVRPAPSRASDDKDMRILRKCQVGQ